MKNSQNNEIPVTNFYHPTADTHISTELPKIKEEVKTFAIDLANQNRPSQKDPVVIFIPKIKGLFETLLETVLKIIGALAVLNEDGSFIKETYDQEERQLNTHKQELTEDKRVLDKELSELPKQLVDGVRKWGKWKWVLFGLVAAETLINFKILLLITPNQISALLASFGLAASLFIISHTMKDVVCYFSGKLRQWIAGLTMTAFVIALLYAFSALRILFMENDQGDTGEISPWMMVAINFAMWASGTIVALVYKPLKKAISDFRRYKIVKDQIQKAETEMTVIKERLDAIPNERAQKLQDLKNLGHMAQHYEQTISANYRSAVALFCSENLLRRKDGLTSPDAFMDDPKPLNTYFKDNHNL